MLDDSKDIDTQISSETSPTQASPTQTSQASSDQTQASSGSPIAFPSFDDLTEALTSPSASVSASSIFSRISESLTRITRNDDDKKEKAKPKKRNLRDLMKSKKKAATNEKAASNEKAATNDEKHSGVGQDKQVTQAAAEEADDGFSWSNLTARNDDDEDDR